MSELVPLAEFSEALGIEEDRVIELIRDGTYRGRKVADEWFVHPPAPESENRRPPALAAWITALVLAALAWLFFLPVLAANAAHFGWGFFPIIATKIASPFITLLLASSSIVVVVQGARSALPIRMWALVALGIDLVGWTGVTVLMWLL